MQQATRLQEAGLRVISMVCPLRCSRSRSFRRGCRRGHKSSGSVDYDRHCDWPDAMTDEHFAALSQRMLMEITAETIYSSARLGRAALHRRVLDALGTVPRHEFVPIELQPYAYLNQPLPIGCGKTISQPFIVAVMTDLLDIEPTDVVLEVGTGLGYQSAILSTLARLGYANVEVKVGNGYHGWPEHAPFDKIIVTAAPELIPPPLIHQLKAGGKMMIPAGLADSQQLMLVEKGADGTVSTRAILPVRFSQLEGSDELRSPM
jgi:protein-L-isoaspartate(D-aspartate) O-methyltransferase